MFKQVKKSFLRVIFCHSLLWCWFNLACLFFSLPAVAEVVFENYDEDELTEGFDTLDGDEPAEMPEIEAAQEDLRLDRKNGLGLSVGEVLPYTTFLFEYHRNLDVDSTVFIAFGRGALNSNLQAEGEDLALNKVSTSAAEVGYTRWISQSFPVAISSLLSIVRADGSLAANEAATGRHRMDSLGLGADLRVQTFFENGFWLKWSLLSFRYLRPIAESHKDFPAAQLSTSRGRFSGLKILGITNITVGYAW